ncbi:MAG: hypothetical protein ACRDT8_00060 [Micromonosporaceae bacterium]
MNGLAIILLILFLGALFVATWLTVEALAERHDYAEKDAVPEGDEITDQLGDVGDQRVFTDGARRFAKLVYKRARPHRSTPEGGQ